MNRKEVPGESSLDGNGAGVNGFGDESSSGETNQAVQAVINNINNLTPEEVRVLQSLKPSGEMETVEAVTGCAVGPEGWKRIILEEELSG